jgi:molybdopterin synthase sulfur carrier subunit
MRLMYFAWVRERIGLPKESFDTDASTVLELISELRQREDRYDLAFSDMSAIRVALDQELIEDLNTSLEGVAEVAFFPPMTGG